MESLGSLQGIAEVATQAGATLHELFWSLDVGHLAYLFMPYLCWITVSAATVLVADAVIRCSLRACEALLLSALYLFGSPNILAGAVLKRRRSCPAPEPRNEPSSCMIVLDHKLFHRLSWRSCREDRVPSWDELLQPSAEQRVDTALYELGVPLSASDEEIRRAYHQLLLQHHPDLFQAAPAATRERSRKMTLKIRSAYDTAIGRRDSPMGAH